MDCSLKAGINTIAVLTIVNACQQLAVNSNVALIMCKMLRYDNKDFRCSTMPTIMVVICVIDCTSASLLFAATSEDFTKNQQRRHSLLPFIVWKVWKITVVVAYAISMLLFVKDYMTLLVITGVLLLVEALLVVIVVEYFKSLSAVKGFDHVQMDDEIKD